MATVVVEVMLKPEIHDPQGDAIASACQRLGFGAVTRVRQGKRFEIEVAEAPSTPAAAGGGQAAAGQASAGQPVAGGGLPARNPFESGPGGSPAALALAADLAAELLANPVIEEFTVRAG